MKLRTILAVALIALLLVGCTPAISPDAATISREEAIEIALDHAGVSAGEASRLQAKQDWDNGILEYDVEFFCNGFEYDYEIDAITGQVLRHEKDRD